MKEMIRFAAVKRSDGDVWIGVHHADCFKKMYDEGLSKDPNWKQGFITNLGKFVDRVEALKIAEENDQIVQKYSPEYELVSEDLIKRLSLRKNKDGK